MNNKFILEGCFTSFSTTSYPYRIYGYDIQKHKCSYEEWLELSIVYSRRAFAIQYLVELID